MYIKIKRNPAHRVILHNVVDLSMKNDFETQLLTKQDRQSITIDSFDLFINDLTWRNILLEMSFDFGYSNNG